ncbi:MAG: hypothetical protein V7646_1643, partial [Pseudonocardia sp.]
GDLVLDVGRRPVQDAQGVQRQLFGDAIGVPLPVTVLRNGAMVDVVAVPTELGCRPRARIRVSEHSYPRTGSVDVAVLPRPRGDLHAVPG